VTIRPAREGDVEFVFSLIVALAEYERARDSVTGSPELLRRALFADPPAAEAVIAERDGEPIGFALFHGTFSTWECRPGIWLEDLFVLPEHRRGGVGEALFRHVAGIALERGYTRYQWVALDWNEPALRFYEKLGATVLRDWLLHRLDGDALRRVAGRTDAAGAGGTGAGGAGAGGTGAGGAGAA
jgi:GNAT superfamily N-acetyltransferase